MTIINLVRFLFKYAINNNKKSIEKFAEN